MLVAAFHLCRTVLVSQVSYARRGHICETHRLCFSVGRLMLYTQRDQTSPRLVNVFYVKDGGSLVVALANARGDQYEVWFDKAIGSTTIGRMMYEAPQADDRMLVEFGSRRERQLLAEFDTLLKRHAEELEADGHNDLKEIQKRLAIYRDLAADHKRRQP